MRLTASEQNTLTLTEPCSEQLLHSSVNIHAPFLRDTKLKCWYCNCINSSWASWDQSSKEKWLFFLEKQCCSGYPGLNEWDRGKFLCRGEMQVELCLKKWILNIMVLGSSLEDRADGEGSKYSLIPMQRDFYKRILTFIGSFHTHVNPSALDWAHPLIHSTYVHYNK